MEGLYNNALAKENNCLCPSGQHIAPFPHIEMIIAGQAHDKIMDPQQPARVLYPAPAISLHCAGLYFRKWYRKTERRPATQCRYDGAKPQYHNR